MTSAMQGILMQSVKLPSWQNRMLKVCTGTDTQRFLVLMLQACRKNQVYVTPESQLRCCVPVYPHHLVLKNFATLQLTCGKYIQHWSMLTN